MRLVFVKTKWEMWHEPLGAFLERTIADGFDATEIYLATETEPAAMIRRRHEEAGLSLVGQILTSGATPNEHSRSLEAQFGFALECGAARINLHAGREIFPFEANLAIFKHVIRLGVEHGVPVSVETHRGRPTFAATETVRYLDALPDLRLTADFSHWMVVHESLLEDQEEVLATAIGRSDHIHARVGHAEGPQLVDPFSPEAEPVLARHVALWRRIVEARRAGGAEILTVAPEAGPPPYMPLDPSTGEPLADAWSVNVAMRDYLREALA
ncbi:hypothetical protein BH23BAC4_BH23BAC4_00720 [soil metagenome]